MGIARYVVFAWIIGALVIAAAWIIPMPQEDGNRRPSALEEGASVIGAGPATDSIEVRLKLAVGRPFAFYSLKDEEGNELAVVTYSRKGLVVNLGEAFRARAGFAGHADGSCSFVASQDKIHYLFKLRPDGASGLMVLDDRNGERDGLGVTRDGRIVHDPSSLD